MLKRFPAIFVLVLTVAALLSPVVARAEPLTAVGDGANLWILQPNAKGDGFTLLYRRISDTPPTDLFSVVASPIQGKVASNSVAAGGSRLWLVYKSGQIQAVAALTDDRGKRVYTDTVHASQPKGTVVRSVAADWNGPWLLVRVEDPAALARIDDKGTEAKQSPNKDSKEEPSRNDDPSKDATKDTTKTNIQPKATVEPSKDAPSNAAPTKGGDPNQTNGVHSDSNNSKTAEDRLLVLQKGQWQKFPLPEDWPNSKQAWLVMESDGNATPWLVTVPKETEKRVRWYAWEPAASSTPDGTDGSNASPIASPKNATNDPANSANQQAGTWRRHEVAVPTVDDISPFASQKQLVIVYPGNTPGQLDLNFHLLQSDRTVDLGTLTNSSDIVGWSVAPIGDSLAAIVKSNDPDKPGETKFTWQFINNTGDADATPVPLTVQKPTAHHLENMYLFLGVMLIATPITILLWKRNPQPQEVKLPEGTRIGDMGARFVAAFIDLMPFLVLAWLLSSKNPVEILSHWAGQGEGLASKWPGGVAVGSFFLYTAIAEMFTGKTFGKHLMKLRVVTMIGEAPDVWQILGRCIFKVLDTLVPLLIILAILSPYKQRLGDLVARTVVVTDALPQETDSTS